MLDRRSEVLKDALCHFEALFVYASKRKEEGLVNISSKVDVADLS